MSTRKTLSVATSVLIAILGSGASVPSPLQRGRNQQNRAALDQMISQLQQQVKTTDTPANQYQLALAYSYAAEIAMEQRDKRKAEDYAEAGVEAARKALNRTPNSAEYHRL